MSVGKGKVDKDAGKTRIKMVACDLDGTLLGPGESGMEAAKEISGFLRSLGIRLTLATGRVFGSVEPFLLQLALTDPVVTNGGALVSAIGEPPLMEDKIDRISAGGIAAELRSLRVPFYYIAGKDMLTEWDGPETVRYGENIGYRITVVPVGALQGMEPTQIVVRVAPEEADRFVESYQERRHRSVQCVKTLPHLVEFQARGVSKARGLSFLSSHFGLEREEVLAIGDGLNDLDMLKWAGISGCVGNAHPEACAKASYVSEKPYAEGVFDIIKKFITPV
jgi:Cof subfamily protein (haloacid dehalogenase superfamily)